MLHYSPVKRGQEQLTARDGRRAHLCVRKLIIGPDNSHTIFVSEIYHDVRAFEVSLKEILCKWLHGKMYYVD